MLFTILLIVSVIEGFLLGIYILISKKLNVSGNKFLAYSIISLSILLLNMIFEVTGIFEKFPLLIFIDDIEWSFLIPTFIFFFILHRVEHPLRKSKKLILLYIPFIYGFILGVIINCNTLLNIYRINEQQQVWINNAAWIEVLLIVFFILTVFPICYSYIKTAESIEERKWLNYLITIIYTLYIFWIIFILTAIAFSSFDNWNYLKGLGLASTILIHWVSYIGVIKNRLYRDRKEISKLLDQHKAVSKEKSDLLKVSSASSDVFTEGNEYYLQLEFLCKEQQLYRDPSLSREKVADILGISSGYVSQIINSVTGENFATYINKYRVNSVKEMIIDPSFKHYNLLALGLESGFTSKTAFYSSFKKVTGMTPSAYKVSQK